MPSVDRHLSDQVAGITSAHDPLDAVLDRDGLDVALEHGEERPVLARVDEELARVEMDVCRQPGEPLTLGLVEHCEDGDSGNLVLGDHKQTLPDD